MASKHYKAREWFTIGHLGYTRAEDEGLWAGMVGGDWEGEGEEELKEETPPPPPSPTPNQHPQTLSHQSSGKKIPKSILSRMTHRMEPSPPPQKKEPPPPQAPLGHKGHPHPRDKSPPPLGGEGMVPTTPSLASRSTSRTQGAWSWAPCAVSTRKRRALYG